MNTSQSNSGGWASSNMRTAICGTSLSSYSGTILAVIPAELRAVLKSVTKYTNNTGNSTAASAVTATTDYFFLLSEYEVFGSTTYANSNEASKQAQYAYYSAGNSKIKYKHNATSTAAFWWLRSPFASYSSFFVRVYADGTVSTSYAAYCHAYSSCERGTNENINRMIRRQFPKGTDFDKVTAAEVKRVETWLNNYPREILGFMSSAQAFELAFDRAA